MNYKHTLKEIVAGTAILSYVCNGKVYFEIIMIDNTKYQLELDSTDEDWKTTYIQPLYKAIALMRWIRKSMADGSLIQLTQ
jgi:hypothetical protein